MSRNRENWEDDDDFVEQPADRVAACRRSSSCFLSWAASYSSGVGCGGFMFLGFRKAERIQREEEAVEARQHFDQIDQAMQAKNGPNNPMASCSGEARLRNQHPRSTRSRHSSRRRQNSLPTTQYRKTIGGSCFDRAGRNCGTRTLRRDDDFAIPLQMRACPDEIPTPPADGHRRPDHHSDEPRTSLASRSAWSQGPVERRGKE